MIVLTTGYPLYFETELEYESYKTNLERERYIIVNERDPLLLHCCSYGMIKGEININKSKCPNCNKVRPINQIRAYYPDFYDEEGEPVIECFHCHYGEEYVHIRLQYCY